MRDGLYFRHVINIGVPPLDLTVLLVVEAKIDHIGHLVEEEQVSDRQLVPSNELCPALGQKLVEIFHYVPQAIYECLLLVFVDGTFGEHGGKEEP